MACVVLVRRRLAVGSDGYASYCWPLLNPVAQDPKSYARRCLLWAADAAVATVRPPDH